MCSLGININSRDESGDTPVLKLCQLYSGYGHEIKQRLGILIEFGASLEAKDNNDIDVLKFLKDNGLSGYSIHEYWRPKKKLRV